HLASSQLTEAQDIIRNALQFDPNNGDAIRMLDEIKRERARQAAREGCDRLVAKGRAQFAAHEYEQAMESLKAALGLDTERADAQSLLKQIRTILEKRERASELAVQAKQEIDSGRLDEAYSSVVKCLEYDPANRDASTLLGIIRAKRDR